MAKDEKYAKVYDSEGYDLETYALLLFKEMIDCKVGYGIRIKTNDEIFTFQRIS